MVADESAEFPAALAYAARLARGAGWRLIMLRVIEPAEPAPWASVSEEIKRQSMSAAENLTQRFSAEVLADTGVETEIIIKEGELRPELKRLLEDEPGIQLAVLGASSSSKGPGPLVASLAKGQGLGGRAVPVLVVPGALSKDEVKALVLPVVLPPSAAAS